MLGKVDLKKEVGSLDMLITALSDELHRDLLPGERDGARARLLLEMEEALKQLRQERGLRKMWLTALEGHDAVETRSDRRSQNPGSKSAH
ncbi:MAG TPA: hypothetical protein VFQ92_19395 [Blastocatellia bacterium]|nr:hypothetical protein [Blastocatellia bacterium]